MIIHIKDIYFSVMYKTDGMNDTANMQEYHIDVRRNEKRTCFFSA